MVLLVVLLIGHHYVTLLDLSKLVIEKNMLFRQSTQLQDWLLSSKDGILIIY